MRIPGMLQILATFGFCISGLSLLLPASPAWVALGGAGSTGAGMVTATVMAITVATQILAVQQSLNYFGWAKTLTAGTLFMGLPSALQAISPDLWLVLMSSALRGIGFGILTVCCSTALTFIVPAHVRGQAIGYYGLAAAVPQLIFTPVAPWLIETLGYRPVLIGGIIASLGAPFAWSLGKIIDSHQAQPATGAGQTVDARPEPLLKRIWPALLTLTLSTAAGGAFMTFASEVAATASTASVALLAMMAMAVPTRLFGGTLTDRWGTRITMTPVLALNAIGVGMVGFSTTVHDDAARLILLLLGSLLTGAGYGFLQSVTMVRALADAGEGNTTRASIAWNANFDLGTGLGGIAIGALASLAGFAGAWYMWGTLILICVVLVASRDFRRAT